MSGTEGFSAWVWEKKTGTHGLKKEKSWMDEMGLVNEANYLTPIRRHIWPTMVKADNYRNPNEYGWFGL